MLAHAGSIASDEQYRVDCIKQAFGDKVIEYDVTFRSISDSPLHYHNSMQCSKYYVGEDVIIEAYLLAKTIIKNVERFKKKKAVLSPETKINTSIKINKIPEKNISKFFFFFFIINNEKNNGYNLDK